MSPADSHDTHSAPAPSFYTTFSPEMQKELHEEDSQAWTAIVALLLGIISTGVLLAVVCVLMTSA
jgi:hypothetical protein